MDLYVSVSFDREQDMGIWNNPSAFVLISLITKSPLCTGLPVTDNPILIGIIIVCEDARNSHIFREICKNNFKNSYS